MNIGGGPSIFIEIVTSLAGEFVRGKALLKTVHFRQVNWVNHPENLVQLLSSTLAARPNVEDTVHNVGAQLCEVRHRGSGPSEVRLHLVTYVTGATKGIRPNTVGVPGAAVQEATPPAATSLLKERLRLLHGITA